MIPQIIHYCWFGHGEMPQKEKECVASWKRFFPDYEIKLWNEDNFNYKDCKFSRQAYDAKKYAFVSDYARAKVLYEYGGVYLDTDFKVLKDFRDVLNKSDGVIGFERRAFIGTAMLATRPKDEIICKLKGYYETHNFVQEDGSFDNIANVSILTDILKEAGLKTGGERQKVTGFEVYNREVFYPKKMGETEFNITEQTVGIHMCSNSWLTERERKRGNNKIWIEIVRPMLRGFRSAGIKIVGKERIRKIEIKLRNFLK
ncbi:MAG: glycosyl transferase [Clostridiales bacterium]|nr:glycosyl transferase [Clostridiales bacterium]